MAGAEAAAAADSSSSRQQQAAAAAAAAAGSRQQAAEPWNMQPSISNATISHPNRPILNRYLPHILVPRVSQANGAAQAAPDQSSGKVARARCLAVGLTLCRPRSGFASKFYRWETQVPARAASSSATVKTRCNSTARSLVPTTTSRLNP